MTTTHITTSSIQRQETSEQYRNVIPDRLQTNIIASYLYTKENGNTDLFNFLYFLMNGSESRKEVFHRIADVFEETLKTKASTETNAKKLQFITDTRIMLKDSKSSKIRIEKKIKAVMLAKKLLGISDEKFNRIKSTAEKDVAKICDNFAPDIANFYFDFYGKELSS